MADCWYWSSLEAFVARVGCDAGVEDGHRGVVPLFAVVADVVVGHEPQRLVTKHLQPEDERNQINIFL